MNDVVPGVDPLQEREAFLSSLGMDPNALPLGWGASLKEAHVGRADRGKVLQRFGGIGEIVVQTVRPRDPDRRPEYPGDREPGSCGSGRPQPAQSRPGAAARGRPTTGPAPRDDEAGPRKGPGSHRAIAKACVEATSSGPGCRVPLEQPRDIELGRRHRAEWSSLPIGECLRFDVEGFQLRTARHGRPARKGK